MENTKNTPVIGMDINDALSMYLHGSEIAKKHRESHEGKQLEHWLKKLNSTANELLEDDCDITCCSKKYDRHFGFQCMFHEEYVIASYNRGDYAHLGMKQVEQFVTFVAAYELKRFISKNIETSAIAQKVDMGITLMLNHCTNNFSENIYVVDFNEGCTTPETFTSDGPISPKSDDHRARHR